MESLQESNKFQDSLERVATTDTELQCAFFTHLLDSSSKKLHLESLRHDILGMLKLPLIGKYSNSEYDFARNVSLTTLLLKSPGSTCNCVSLTNGVVNNNLLVSLPVQIRDLLSKIPNPIPENNRETSTSITESTNQKKITSFFNKSQAGQSNQPKQSKEELDMEADILQSKNEQNKGYSVSDTFELHWMISLNTFPNKKSTGSNHTYKAAKQDPKELILNYVLHPFLFPDLDFSKKKRQFTLTPITLWPSDGFREDIEEYREEEKSKAKRHNGISFEEFRMEYSSIHMRGQSLCFSPNNLKFIIKPDSGIISDFWTVILDKTDNKNKVFYHWLINSEDLHEIVESICVNTKNLSQLILELESLIGTDNPAIQMCKNTFQFASSII